MKNFILIGFAVLLLFFTNSLLCQVTFTDVAPLLGVNDGGAAQGVVFLDVNNDGYLDIFLANNNNQSRLWINNGGSAYLDSSAKWGLNIISPTRGTSAADFNNDGLIDIIIGNWQTPIMLFKNTGTGFIDVSAAAGVNFMSYGGSVNWIDHNLDGKIDFLFANDGMPPRYNYFFKNENLSTFINIAYSIGFVDSSSTLCLAATDYDNDGFPDIFLGTQSNPGNPTTGILYRNNWDGTFSDVTASSGLVTYFYTWGAEWGDYNNDGYMDLYLANTNNTNQLFRNNGNGTFTEVSSSMGLNDLGQSYSCGWADIDNDGDLDLYVAKGQTYMDKMYRNDESVFTDISTACGMGDLRHSSCVSWGDYTNDGFLDLYLNNNGTENRLYRNSGNSNKWVEFNLTGTVSNKSAIGARVRIKTGTKSQIREVEGGSGGKGMNSLTLEFGIGQANIIDSVIVNWPSGIVQRFVNIAPNKIYKLTEGGQPIGVSNNTTGVPEYYSLSQNYPNPFNPGTNIKYQITNSSYVSLKIYNLLGKEVATLVNEKLSAGTYQAEFKAVNIPSGVYYYTLKTDNFTETKKMIYLK